MMEDPLFVAFRNAHLRVSPGRILNITEVTKAFSRWADDNKHTKPASIWKFLVVHLGTYDKKPVHDSFLQKSIRGWRGWELIGR